jgi:hypothetical protein
MKKNVFLILKILMVCIVLCLIVLSILIYVEKQNRVIVPKNKTTNNGVIKQISKEELTANYKSSVLGILDSFNGNYQETRNKLVEVSGVPADLTSLHFDIVVAFDYVVFKDDKTSAKQRLEKIYTYYYWLKQPLTKIIESVK